jgi:hypothetical protein
MAILIKNSGTGDTPECTIPNKFLISTRVSEADTDINNIKAAISAFKSKIDSSTDTVINNFYRATSFPIEDINQLLINNPDCKYVRVYNGLSPTNEHITFIAPIYIDFNSFTNADMIITKSCCQCKPCLTDSLLT